MNVKDPAAEMIHKVGRQNAHKARQNHHGRIIAVKNVDHGIFKSLTGFIGLMVHAESVDAELFGALKARCARTVTHHTGDFEPLFCPAGTLRFLDDGDKIRASSGQKNDNVFHGFGKNRKPTDAAMPGILAAQDAENEVNGLFFSA